MQTPNSQIGLLPIPMKDGLLSNTQVGDQYDRERRTRREFNDKELDEVTSSSASIDDSISEIER